MTSAPLSLRAFVHRLLVALVICVSDHRRVGVAVGPRRRRQGREDPRRRRSTRACSPPGGNYLIIGSDTRAFVDRRKPTPSTSASADDADRSALRHDHGRPHRSREAHRRARVVPARPVGRRSPVTAAAKINAAFAFGGPQLTIADDRAGLRHPDQPLPRGRLRRLPRHRERDRQRADLLPDARRATRTPGSTSPTAGCHNLNGDDALAYVRSRYYQYQDSRRPVAVRPDLRPRPDPAPAVLHPLAGAARRSTRCSRTRSRSQQGARQDRGEPDPRQGPQASDLLALVLAFRNTDPTAFPMYTLPATNAFRDGQSVLLLDSRQAAPMLARLRGNAHEDARAGPEDLAVDRHASRSRTARAPAGAAGPGPERPRRRRVPGARRAGDRRRSLRLRRDRGPLRPRCQRRRPSSCSRTSAARASSSPLDSAPERRRRGGRARPGLPAGHGARRRPRRATPATTAQHDRARAGTTTTTGPPAQPGRRGAGRRLLASATPNITPRAYLGPIRAESFVCELEVGAA